MLVDLCDTMDYVVLQSHDGYFLRFLKEEVPEKKKAALGVRAIKMSDKDYLEHGYLLESRMEYQIEYKEKADDPQQDQARKTRYQRNESAGIKEKA